MKYIIVNGEKFRLEPLRTSTVEPGAVVGQLDARRVYRVLCADGDDLVLRNVRHADLLAAFPKDEVLREFGRVCAIV